MYNNTPGSGVGNNYYADDLWTVKDANGAVLGMMDSRVVLSDALYFDANCVQTRYAKAVQQTATGIVIPAGDTIYIDIPTYGDNLSCYSNCSLGNTTWWYYNAAFEYQDQCEITNYSQNRTGLGSNAPLTYFAMRRRVCSSNDLTTFSQMNSNGCFISETDQFCPVDIVRKSATPCGVVTTGLSLLTCLSLS